MRTVLTLVEQRPLPADRDLARSDKPCVATGDYLLGERIGRGGMADVFAAQRCADGSQVAIKILHPQLASLRAHLELEADVLARLPAGCAPALVAFACSSDGQSCLVMERLFGQDLHRLARRTALPPAQALAIVTRVARVLDQAHDLGIVHRDLKPGNVFLCDAAEHVLDLRVLDFGIALLPGRGSPAQKCDGEFVGSPGYLAPEQVVENGLPIGPHTDVFGLAALAYRLFTGLPMFTCHSSAEAAFQATYLQPAPASRVRCELPVALDAVLARALSKLPHERPARAGELAQELAQALG